ncbi:hypothetical protein FJT64_024685 [Amphibalanus amphitrite]|uniref:Uncharacterized protein n=2 Tax=Amphibalanus amphitrite TaxID=1232801 RepID=A0A6A4WHK8_AMPAM|nr:hypothetical protein FJT64_024685 [Amphibalanus amphitrite]
MTRCQLMQTNDNMNTNWQSADCRSGREVTRTELGSAPRSPTGAQPVVDQRYGPTARLSQLHPSTDGRSPCRWCGAGGSRASQLCLTGRCRRLLVAERRDKEQLVQLNRPPYADLSLEKNPRCSACHTAVDAQRYR